MKITKNVLEDIEFSEHVDDMRLALFLDNKLDRTKRDELFKHLAECKRCRDILRTVREIEKEQKAIKLIRYFKAFIPIMAGVIIFLAPSITFDYSATKLKGADVEVNILDRSLYFWKDKLEEWFFDD
jgi:uncharacterized paraquat-inducible protein A